VTVSRNIDAALAGSDDLSGTVRVHAKNVSLYALNIENTFGKPVDQAQAIALSVEADEFGGYGLNLTSVQDTLLANGPGGNFFSNCLIQGSVDFVCVLLRSSRRSVLDSRRSLANTLRSGSRRVY
jgi:pectinesterase